MFAYFGIIQIFLRFSLISGIFLAPILRLHFIYSMHTLMFRIMINILWKISKIKKKL